MPLMPIEQTMLMQLMQPRMPKRLLRQMRLMMPVMPLRPMRPLQLGLIWLMPMRATMVSMTSAKWWLHHLFHCLRSLDRTHKILRNLAEVKECFGIMRRNNKLECFVECSWCNTCSLDWQWSLNGNINDRVFLTSWWNPAPPKCGVGTDASIGRCTARTPLAAASNSTINLQDVCAPSEPNKKMYLTTNWELPLFKLIMMLQWENVKTLLNKSLTIYDTKRTMFCLSFLSRDRATAPGRYEQFYFNEYVPYPQI